MSSSERPKNASTIANLTAAMVAGSIAELSSVPFDSVKVSNQVGTPASFQEVTTGILSKSLGSVVGRQILKTSFAFGLYQPILTFYSGGPDASTFSRAAASITSGLVGSLVAFPFDVMTVQAQAGAGAGSMSRAAAAMPLYLSRQTVTFSTQLFAYDWLKSLAVSTGTASDSLTTHAVCGFLAGGLAAVVSNPLDVSTVNVQALKQTTAEAVKSMAIPEYAVRGLGFHALRLGTWNAVMFVAFEKLKSGFGTR